MSRTPFDTFSKQLLEELLYPFGSVELNPEVSGESRFVDVRFIPHPSLRQIPDSDAPLLSRIIATDCLIEPFRNPIDTTNVRNCLLKLFLVQADQARRVRRTGAIPTPLPAYLWILTPTLSASVINSFAAQADLGWETGIYRLADGLQTSIIAIHQLPQTEETLWFRLLGRGRVQQQAIEEVLALSNNDPRRGNILQLLVNWKINLERTGNPMQEEVALMATLSQAYQEWEQQTLERGLKQGIERGERSLLLRLLTRKLGTLPDATRTRVDALPGEQVERLADALLDLATLEELDEWLNQVR